MINMAKEIKDKENKILIQILISLIGVLGSIIIKEPIILSFSLYLERKSTRGGGRNYSD